MSTVEIQSTPLPRQRAKRRSSLLGALPWLVLAALSFPAMVRAKPGWIATDTKVYLYLNPGKLLSSAQSLWNPDVGLGTVTHQNIGYLFPMGPYFWLIHAMGIPMWVGQRFWIGGLFFLAGGGVLYLGRLLGLTSGGRLVAAIAYMLSPYVLDYITRASAIVMPWAGLGWMIGFTILAARRGGWRYPALFALVVALVGGVNATSILFAGIAPVLWLIYAVGLKEITWRDVWRVSWRIGTLSLVVSLWWASGLWAEGAYGINILLFTETIPTVVATSLSSEVLRGLGYWYFYGADAIQQWTLAAPAYMRQASVIAISFAVPTVAMAFGFLARWRYRGYAVLLVALGVVFSVSAFPIKNPTPFGTILRAAGEGSTIGLAMRSSSRVVPLVVLGLALMLGAGLSALGHWRWWCAAILGTGVAALAVVNMMPLFDGSIIPTNLEYPEHLPHYVSKTASFLNSQGTSSRVLGLPGEDFAYYRWGATMDSIWPGLLNRPYVSRQAVAMGEPASVNIVRALDESIQDGVFDSRSVAPLARLMSVGDVLLQSDLQYERYQLPLPQALWLDFNPAPPGLGSPATFGPQYSDSTLVGPIINEQSLAIPPGADRPPALAVFPVASPRPLIRTEPTAAPTILAGDGEGLLEAGIYGLLNNNQAVIYSASLASPKEFAKANTPGSVYVVTDSNARRLDAWGTLHTTYGYVARPGEKPISYNPNEQSMAVFPGAPSSTQTVSVLNGIAAVNATAYGNPIANVPENQPANAVDGDPRTAWEEGSFSKATGESLVITLEKPTTTDHVRLLQPTEGPRNRTIKRVTLRFDGRRPVKVSLGSSSLSAPGQLVAFSPRTFRKMSITIDATSGSQVNFSPYSGVGFAEVQIGDVPAATTALRLPTDLLSKAGLGSDNHPLHILLNRLRANGLPPRLDPELSMRRIIDLPTTRSFTVNGTARISDLIPDPLLNQLVGRTTSTAMAPGQSALDRVTFTNSSGRLLGDLNASSWSGFDSNSQTAWQTGFWSQAGSWIEAGFARPLSVSHLDLQVVNDGRHQLPSRITLSMGSDSRSITLPKFAVPSHARQGSISMVPINFAPMEGSKLRMTIDTIQAVRTRDPVGVGVHIAPLAIAEVGVPGVAEPLTPAALPQNCLSGLLAMNGTPTPVTITGSTTDALDLNGNQVSACPIESTVVLHSGQNSIATGDGSTLGWNVDQLALSSAPSVLGATASQGSPPALKVNSSNRWSAKANLTGNGQSAWLVLGQSLSEGWHATLNGRDLGPPLLIDGYAAGWMIPSLPVGTHASVTFTWTPQHVVNIAELLSLMGLILVVGLIIAPARRRGRRLVVLPATLAPSLTNPLAYSKPTTRWSLVVLLPVLTGFSATFLAGFAAGVITGFVTLVGLLFRWSRVLLILGSVGAMFATGAITVAMEHKYHFLVNIGWPQHFTPANEAGWIAVMVLMADAIVEGARIRFPRQKGSEGADGESIASDSDGEGSIEDGQSAMTGDLENRE